MNSDRTSPKNRNSKTFPATQRKKQPNCAGKPPNWQHWCVCLYYGLRVWSQTNKLKWNLKRAIMKQLSTYQNVKKVWGIVSMSRDYGVGYIETMVWEPEVVPDPQSTPERFCVFLWDPDPESKICEKTDPASLFNFGSSRSLCGHFSSKNMGKLRLDRWL